MRGSYYDVLGVVSTASDAEIRARYLRLIRHYHPDHNQSALAHARAAALNEAFHVLSDPKLRSWHDAQLAAQHQDAMADRARDLAQQGGRALVVRRGRRTLLQRYGARLALIILLVGTGIAGWQIEDRLLGGDTPPAVSDSSDGDGDGGEARRAVQALTAATAREAQTMPPVSSSAVARGVGAYLRIAANGDGPSARSFSERCHAQAANADNWELLDFCVAFDQAALAGATGTTKPAIENTGYFVDRHDRAEHLYISRVSSLDAIEGRLGQIRSQVTALQAATTRTPTAQVLHRISKKGWKIAGAAWHVFDSPSTERRIIVGQHPSDF